MVAKVDPSVVFPAARKAYLEGASLRHIKRKFHLTDSEVDDVAPEEVVEEHSHPEGIGGY